MKTFLALASAATVLLASYSAASAAPKRPHHGHKAYYNSYNMMRSSPFRGNAAMSGNNGNSASGSNSLGHIKGGDSGAGE